MEPVDAYGAVPSRSNDLAFADLMRVLWDGKWILVVGAAIGFGLGIAFSHLPLTKYRASVLISPVSMSGDIPGVSGSGLGGLGTLAALAGVSLGGDSSKAEALAVLESSGLTETYIHDHGLLPVLFRDKWDEKQGKWKSAEDAPTLWKANRFFAKNVRRVSTDGKTGLVTLAITWSDARQAAEWANGLVELANSYLREKAMAESDRNIAYLNDEATKASAVEVRQAIYSLLKNEINKQMIAKGAPDYAFKVIDVAQIPEDKVSPIRKVWALMGMIAGGATGVATVLLLAAFGQQRRPGPVQSV